MYKTILGKEGFRKGMDLYFKRHDGSAVTCDDFLSAMGDANGVDLSQFARWYSTNGTPTVRYSGEYKSGTFYLTLSQESNSKEPLHIPISVGLLDKETGEEVVATKVLDLKEKEQIFEFPELKGDVLPSVLRDFSAPVKLLGSSDDEEKDWAFLVANDSDGFNRWECGQKLFTSAIFQTLRGEDASKTMNYIYDEFERSLNLKTDDFSIQAYTLTLPAESVLFEDMKVVDPVGLHKARGAVKKAIARKFYSQIRAKYDNLTSEMEEKEFSVDATSIGRRRLRNVLLDFLCTVKETPEERETASKLAFDQFTSSPYMTDKYSALQCLVSMDGEKEVVALRESAIKTFYKDAEGDALILDKWFTAQAQADLPGVIDRVKALTEHPEFTLSNPNRCRSLISAFSQNAAHYHAENGEGYKFFGEQVAKADKLNPQLSARLGKTLIQWKRYGEEQGAMMKAELEKLKSMKPISDDLFEVVSQGLK